MDKNLVRVHAVIKCRYRSENVHPKALKEHTHDFYQLVYVVAGEGQISIDQKDVTAKEGDIFFLRPVISHSFCCKSGTTTTYEMKFDILSESLAMLFDHYPIKLKDENQSIKGLFLSIIKEGNRKEKFYESVITLYAAQILYALVRLETFHPQQKLPDRKPLFEELNREECVIDKVKHYIEEHYLSKISLHGLAEKFLLSEAHLCREFTKKFDMSPIKYINFLRLERAKELLGATDLTITEISEASGFNGIHYFSRYFTKMEKLTPYEYRTALREGFIIRFDT